MSYHCTKGHVFGAGSNKYVVGARIDVAVKVIYTEHLTVIVQKERVFCYFFWGCQGALCMQTGLGTWHPLFCVLFRTCNSGLTKGKCFLFFIFFGGCQYVFLIQTGLCK